MGGSATELEVSRARCLIELQGSGMDLLARSINGTSAAIPGPDGCVV